MGGKNAMNIAVNCRLLQKGRLEGIGWFMYENLKRITREHSEHEFFFIFDRDFDEEFRFAPNVHCIVVGPKTRHPFLWYYWFEWRIPSLLKKVKADLFFSPDGYLSLRSKVPQIPVIHDINFVHRPKDLPFWTRHYYNLFFPLFARKGNRICTVSRYSKKDISQSYNIAKPLIHVVYNGSNESYNPLTEKEKEDGRQRFADGDDYFIFIGSIHPRKNLDTLILAYEQFVKKTKLPVRLVIVGANMWSRSVSKILNIGARKRRQNQQTDYPAGVHFTGRLEAEDLRIALGSALAMTFVPWFEGFGIPVLESMSAGVPVLTSTETSLPEVGGDAVLYAHPGDIQGIAAQMEKLASDRQLREELIEKGLQQQKKFSWDKTARKVWLCIDTVIKGLEKIHE